LAWANAATPAWSKICALVKLADSVARSASRIVDSAAWKIGELRIGQVDGVVELILAASNDGL